MIVDSGKERVIELIDGDLDYGELGTGTTAVSATQTTLITEVTSTIETLSGTPNNKQLVIDYNLDSITGNGNTYTEYATFIGTSDVMFNRVVFTGVPKTTSIEFQVKTIVNIP